MRQPSIRIKFCTFTFNLSTSPRLLESVDKINEMDAENMCRFRNLNWKIHTGKNIPFDGLLKFTKCHCESVRTTSKKQGPIVPFRNSHVDLAFFLAFCWLNSIDSQRHPASSSSLAKKGKFTKNFFLLAPKTYSFLDFFMEVGVYSFTKFD